MTGAGDLVHRVAFDLREPASDGMGNTVAGVWTEQFQRRAAFIYAGGGEAVTAARLEGRGVMKVRVRSDSQTRTILQSWQMRDARRGDVYAIREIDAVTDRQWVYLTVERGVAS